MMLSNAQPPQGGEPLSDQERAELALMQCSSIASGTSFLRQMGLAARPGAEALPKPYTTPNGPFVVDGREYSGWMNTDAVRYAGCPTCGALIGERCHTPGGRNTPEPHSNRTTEFLAQPGVKRSWFTNYRYDLTRVNYALEQAEAAGDAPVAAALRKRKEEIEARVADMDARKESD